jgi:hypothetical protein
MAANPAEAATKTAASRRWLRPPFLLGVARIGLRRTVALTGTTGADWRSAVPTIRFRGRTAV